MALLLLLLILSCNMGLLLLLLILSCNMALLLLLLLLHSALWCHTMVTLVADTMMLPYYCVLYLAPDDPEL